jgi:hypothetical protein
MARYRKKKQRLDLRNGGRVAYQTGGESERETGRADEQAAADEAAFRAQYEQNNPPPSGAGGAAGSQQLQAYNEAYNKAYREYQAAQKGTPAPTPTPTPTPKPSKPPKSVAPTTTPVGSLINPTPTITPAEAAPSSAPPPAPAPKPTTAPPTVIDVKAPTTAPATQEYGPQTEFSETEGVVTDAQGNPLEGNPPIWYWDTVSGSWRPTDAMIAQEKTYGRIWDNQTGSFVDPDVGFSQYLTDEQELERQQRLERSASDLEAAKRGELPIPQITAPQMIEEGPASEVVQMAQPTKVGDVTIFGEGEDIPQESITTGTVSTAKAPDSVKASTYTAEQIKDTPVINAKTGSVSPEALAAMQSQSLTKAATGVTISEETATKVLTDRVVGVLSEGAMATEQAVKGLDLPKVLRAKKQLRNAGFSEAQIEEIGNDPAALEERLMNLTEAERGMIEGLPEEALVSTQMDNLLQGLDSGQVPSWAKPAVAAVNQMMAARGLEVSTVGRDALFNAIIQSALPIAQSNAQAIQQSVAQQKGIEAQAEITNAQLRQQTALTNASNVFKMNMAQFSADQQTALSNSKFLQTVTIANATNEQQAVIQEAASLAQLDLATLDSNTKIASQNAQAFLSMDLTNLGNRQQTEILKAQQEQQRLLSNQASRNAALQFNATSENQVSQFMANLAQQTRQFNAQQMNAMEQFNAQQENAAEARRVQNELAVAQADAAMKAQIDQFNSQQDFARNQWNAQNQQAVLQADVKWRRQLNTANTAAINAVNQQNAQNAFGLSQQAQAFMWQELRDQADYAFRSADNYEQRKSAMYIAMLGNESGNYEGGNWQTYAKGAEQLLNGFMDN